MSNAVFGVLVALAGLFSIAASWFNWDWYFNNHRARLFVSLLGRQGARIAYAILGLVLVVLGAVAMFP